MGYQTPPAICKISSLMHSVYAENNLCMKNKVFNNSNFIFLLTAYGMYAFDNRLYTIILENIFT
jgi:hypothetical protein